MTRDIIEINGFIVLIEQSNTKETVVEKCGFDDGVIGIAFYGSGNVELNIQNDKQVSTYQNTKGVALSFYASRNSTFEHTISPDGPMQSICIVSNMSNFKKLPQQEQEFYYEHLKSLVDPQKDIVDGPGFYMNHDMQSAVEKIFNTSYSGSTRLLFLRSQVTELLSHFFAQVAMPVKPSLKGAEREKIYEAKDILSQNITTPPTLSQLAKQIGLNSHKLKKNFKEVFGVPVFKHLQNERLIKAHEILKEGDLGIQEAAWQVGYESVSSFSNAFSKKFGFRPSEVKH